MAIVDLYQSSEHRNNLAHFSAIVNLALIDGAMNAEEENKVKSFAKKLDISKDEYQEIIENPSKYPLVTPISATDRMERLHDLFKIIYADHIIDEAELNLVHRYAAGLGYSAEIAKTMIDKSIKIFGGNIDFEDYEMLINKK